MRSAPRWPILTIRGVPLRVLRAAAAMRAFLALPSSLAAEFTSRVGVVSCGGGTQAVQGWGKACWQS